MNFELEILGEIDRYLNGELSEEELSRFKNKMAKDPAFKNLVDSHKAVNSIIIGNRLAEVSNLISQDFKNGKVKPGKNEYNKWLLGGLIILACSLAIIKMPESSKPTKQAKVKVITPSQPILKDKKEPVGDLKVEEEAPKEARSFTKKKKEEALLKPSEPIEHSKLKDLPFDTIKTVSPETSGEEQIFEEDPEKATIKVPEINEPISTKENLAKVTKDSKTDCRERFAEVSVYTEPSCPEKASGSISVLKGSESVLMVGLVSGPDTIKNTSGNFNNLSSGEYKVFVEDKDRCFLPVKTVKVSEKNCNEKKIYSFSPAYNETFKFPLNKDKDGTITIFDRSGKIIYHATIVAGYPSEWKGMSINGNEVPSGTYIYKVEFKSGSGETGQILVY